MAMFKGSRKCGALASAALIAASWIAAPGQALAGSVAGFGGSTEITQILNNLQLIQSYEQQVNAYLRQGLQLQNELTNLIKNPTSILGQDVGNMINSVGKIMSGGQSIGYNLAQIDKNFANTFKSPVAMDYSKAFTRWHKINTDTLEGALKTIGATRDQYQSNQDALTDLYNKSQASQGNLQALQTLSQINVRQIQQLQGLQELMASQATAATTYMAAQNAKEQKTLDTVATADDKDKRTIPSVSNAPSPKWKDFWK
jgi:P-type conjugative transfer protein TrbJ